MILKENVFISGAVTVTRGDHNLTIMPGPDTENDKSLAIVCDLAVANKMLN